MRATIKPNELAKLSGYTSQRIRQLQADGVLPQSVARGKLPADAAIAALFAHMRAKLEKYSESRSANQNREQSAKATLAEIAMHEKLGNLSPTQWLRESVSDLAVTIRECVMTTPGVPEAIRQRVQQTLHDMELRKRASHLRPTCPRCRIPIFDDLDKLDEKLEEPINEKKRNHSR